MEERTDSPLKITQSKAFETLVRKHHKLILSFAQSIINDPLTAAEIVKDAFVAAFEQPDVEKEPRELAAGVRRIIRARYLDYCREKKTTPLRAEILDELETTYADWEQKTFGPLTMFHILRKCLKEIPEASFQAIDLFYLKGLPIPKVAQQMECDKNTVKQRLEHARHELRSSINSALKKPESLLQNRLL